jgi:vacuolar-type H+-ATPase subunit I/STV1
MAKKNSNDFVVAELQPDEINAVKVLVKEFMTRLQTIDSEVELLKEDRKALLEEYKEKLDYKTLQLAIKSVKIQNSVVHRDAYDLFVEALTDCTQ